MREHWAQVACRNACINWHTGKSAIQMECQPAQHKEPAAKQAKRCC